MKSQRRHDLETNVLAKRLAVWGDRVRPYSTVITVTTVAIAAVVVVWLIASRYMAARSQRAWDVYTYAMTSATPDWGALREAAEEHPGTPMGELASITWADAQLRMAAEEFFRDEAESQEHLESATEAYRRLIDEADDESIKNRARLGLARALETAGKVKEAQEMYSAVEGPFAAFAQERAKQLSVESTQEAIQWLATAEMPEVEAPIGPGTPGLRPPFGSDFSLTDPQIPPTPSGSDPLMTGGAANGAATQTPSETPLEFENPFTTPSDPDRYATPPQEGEDSAPAQPAVPESPAGDQNSQNSAAPVAAEEGE